MNDYHQVEHIRIQINAKFWMDMAGTPSAVWNRSDVLTPDYYSKEKAHDK